MNVLLTFGYLTIYLSGVVLTIWSAKKLVQEESGISER